MSFNPASPVTGLAFSGRFTTPTYTLVDDVAPSINGKQFAVTTLGGTQTNVEAHTVSKPFTVSFFRPPTLRVLPQANPVTGVIKNVPMNSYKFITRKGVQPAADQNPIVARITTTIDIPAGSETYEVDDVAAMLGAHIGILNGNNNDFLDIIETGVI